MKPNESIIEREIRLQKEKEEEIARTRKSSSSTQQLQKQEQHSSAQHEQHIQHEVLLNLLKQLWNLLNKMPIPFFNLKCFNSLQLQLHCEIEKKKPHHNI